MSGWSTALIIAQLTLTRLFRGRAVWVSVIIAALPMVFAFAIRAQRADGTKSNFADDVLAFEMLLLAIVPAMFVSSSIGDDIEDRTTTYLWSRPVPRWSVIVGKLLALAPLSALVIAASYVSAVYVGNRAMPSVQTTVAVAAGTIVVCFACAGIATLVPKHGMPLTIAYMLFFDLPVGLMPISLAKLSITYQLRVLGGIHPEEPAQNGVIGLAVLATLWLALALWRIRRLEA
jgi:ABC-type transport system involved in multi-copper enzyme maturation permease subunit